MRQAVPGDDAVLQAFRACPDLDTQRAWENVESECQARGAAVLAPGTSPLRRQKFWTCAFANVTGQTFRGLPGIHTKFRVLADRGPVKLDCTIATMVGRRENLGVGVPGGNANAMSVNVFHWFQAGQASSYRSVCACQ